MTTASAHHSPEFDYIEGGVNGLVVTGGDAPDNYAAAVITLLSDAETWNRLSAGALSAASRYTVEDAAERFVDGLESALTGIGRVDR